MLGLPGALPPKLRRAAWWMASLLLSASLFVYATRIEPHWIRATDYDLSAGRPAPLLIAHLTDFHVEDDRSLERVRHALAMVRAREPDLIVLTGDYYTESIVLAPQLRDLLRELASLAPTMAIGGNHDGGYWSHQRGGYEGTRELKNLFSGTGVRFLENQLDTVVLRGRRLLVYGAGDLWAGMCDSTLPDLYGPDTSALRLLLVHNPDARYRFRSTPWQVLFAGHTHGGQIRIPLVGTPFAPVEDKRTVHGLIPEENRHLVVSSGIGNLHGVRLGARPEVVFLRL